MASANGASNCDFDLSLLYYASGSRQIVFYGMHRECTWRSFISRVVNNEVALAGIRKDREQPSRVREFAATPGEPLPSYEGTRVENN